MSNKIKQSGLENNYTDSLYHEWFVIMNDAAEFSMFKEDGSDTMWKDVLNYSESTIHIIGVRPISVAKAEKINNYPDHNYTVIASINKPFQLENTIFSTVPYMMRRKHIADGYMQTFYVIGSDINGNEFYIINKYGEYKQGNNKLLQWN